MGGSSTNPPPQQRKKKKKAQPSGHPIYHSQEEQRAARSKLVQKKQINVQSELNKKEKMLHIMNAADAAAQGQKVPDLPKSMQHETASPNSTKSSKSGVKTKNNTTQSSVFMADPSSKEALAAENRIKQKQSNRAKNAEERKNRTRDLLFGDGLKIKEDDMDYTKYNDDNASNINKKKGVGDNNKSAQFYKSDKDVPLSSNSKTANAALARFGQQKNNKVINSKDRKARTMQLMHGDLLKNQDEVKAAPRDVTYYDDDLDIEVRDVHQSILNLNNCNPHEKMPATAKLLRKIITNILSAESKSDQEKFGKLRLTNKKIKATLVEMEYGVETLQSLGFSKKKIYNDKEHKMDDYMVFDFMNINHKALIHVMDKLNEYYPEQ